MSQILHFRKRMKKKNHFSEFKFISVLLSKYLFIFFIKQDENRFTLLEPSQPDRSHPYAYPSLDLACGLNILQNFSTSATTERKIHTVELPYHTYKSNSKEKKQRRKRKKEKACIKQLILIDTRLCTFA